MTFSPTRRTVLVVTGGAAAALATGCGNDGDGASSDAADSTTSDGAGGALAKTTDIPEGGGKVFTAEKVVVTQPTKGDFKAFSAVCTHQGCTVGSVADGTINCPCHKSEFRIADGSVASGPATKPLPEKQITVQGDSITLT
ncbi:Rieske (2Fe-2S) protein [Streptomyces griseoruber]|uniref:Cytochrome bc1 complex Rieske iron-sulfur subunit n=1 Tax=Streptomyces griseoruber TaxID=1943 RepID=A0A101SNC0_9ACTN|nr:Rieske (2Fe-2S) protein [Streptomyces griseoruber]KUN77247.1 iron-sulfur protein [Streptomyces griseoruber]